MGPRVHDDGRPCVDHDMVQRAYNLLTGGDLLGAFVLLERALGIVRE